MTAACLSGQHHRCTRQHYREGEDYCDCRRCAQPRKDLFNYVLQEVLGQTDMEWRTK